MRLIPLLGLLVAGCGSGAVSEPPVTPPAISSVVTITPSDQSCAPAICSGGDAIVTAQLTQGDQPLAGRAVRFSVVSGDFRFITSQPGQDETLDVMQMVPADATGKASVRARALPGAQNQSGLLQATDVTSGTSQVAGFPIAHVSEAAPSFFVAPDTVTFSGPTTSQCATGTRADIVVFGGTPPYSILPAGAPFAVSSSTVSQSGGAFSVTAAGICTSPFPITVLDSEGRTALVRVSSIPGTTQAPALDVEPKDLTLATCDAVGTFVFVGGTGAYTATASDDSIVRVDSGISSASFRRNPKVATTPAQVAVVVTSGAEVQTVTVHIDAISCP